MITSLTLPTVCFYKAFVVYGYIAKSTFSKTFFRNIIRVSNSLNPDQARHFVGPDLGPICLQRLSADDISKQKVNALKPEASSIMRALSGARFTDVRLYTL